MPPDVPATVKAKVPEEVIGEPATEIKPPVNDWATLVTVPVVGVVQVGVAPYRLKLILVLMYQSL